MRISRLILSCGITLGLLCANASSRTNWSVTSADALVAVDDDFVRNNNDPEFFDGLEIAEYRFSENGFNWHLIRFASITNSSGPMWLVPHDDENAAFDAMIMAVKKHGGVAVAVNSGIGSLRMQSGNGFCGISLRKQKTCDPNRNFDKRAPLFTSVILKQRPSNQPIIALHTNSPGFVGDGKGGRGEISIVDREAFRRGEIVPRAGGVFAVNPNLEMSNFDTLALIAYLKNNTQISEFAIECGNLLSSAGIHFWHEPVTRSDGSMSNYLALNHPEIAYVNFESRIENNLDVASARHIFMVSAYLKHCVSRNNPASRP